MNEMTFSTNPEKLLSHSGFVRAMAINLLQDEHRAEDAAQETWLAAIKHPPQETISVKEWLATVAKNFARMGIREEKRRRRREICAARPEATRSTSEIIEQENTRRMVVNAVFSLTEPNRSAILFRFYDNLPPREIAKICQVPVETVKTRIQRGLAQLKKHLDAKYGGDRNAWCLALAPLAGLKLTAPATVGVGAKFAAALALFLGAIFTFGVISLMPENTETGPSSLNAVSISPSPQGSTDATPLLAHSMGLNGMEKNNKAAIKPKGMRIAGKVTDQKTGQPIRAFHFDLIGPEEGAMLAHLVQETVHSEDGSFSFPITRGGTYQIIVRSSKHILKDLYRLKVSNTKGLTDLNIALEPGLTVQGRVVDQHTGKAIKNALVGLNNEKRDVLSARLLGFSEMLDKGFSEHEVHARTDENGFFTLTGVRNHPQKIVAMHSGYALGWTEYFHKENKPVEIRLNQGLRVFGKAFSDEGSPIAGVRIHMQGESFPIVRVYTTDGEGCFQTDFALPGKVVVWTDPYRSIDQIPPFTPETKSLELVNKDVEVIFNNKSPDYVRWRGKVYDYDHTLIKGGEIALFASHNTVISEQKETRHFSQRFIKIDQQGRFDALKILPGRYQVQVNCSRNPFYRGIEWGELTFDKPGLVEKDLHISGGVISGVVNDSEGKPLKTGQGVVMARCVNSLGDRRFCTQVINDQGEFNITGLAPGVYSIWASKQSNDCAWGGVDGIHVKRNERKSNIRIDLPAQGNLKIKFEGFDYPEFKRFAISLTMRHQNYLNDKGYLFSGYDLAYDLKTRSGELNLNVQSGMWDLTLAYKIGQQVGFMEKQLNIVPNQLAEICLNRDELPFYNGTVQFSGNLSALNQKSLEALLGGELVLKPIWAELDDESERIVIPIDEEGRFNRCEIPPGRYDVSGVRRGSARISFPEQVISSDRNLELEVPMGALTGVLMDSRTSGLLGPHCSKWSAALYSREILQSHNPYDFVSNAIHRHRPICEVWGQTGNGRFVMQGVPDGQFFMVINAQGYHTHIVEYVAMRNGADLNLDQIYLRPCCQSLLKLTCTDRKAPGPFKLIINNDLCYSSSGSNISPKSNGTFMCDKLPTGLTHFQVKMDGYKDGVASVYLEPGDVYCVKVTMRAK